MPGFNVHSVVVIRALLTTSSAHGRFAPRVVDHKGIAELATGIQRKCVERISLAPGEARRVSFVIRPAQDLRRFDPDKHAYLVDDGRYEARVGASSRDIRLHKTFQIAKAR